jgi:hypothetical protein
MKTLTRDDTSELRRFGVGLGLLLVVAFWGLLPWWGDYPRPGWPIVAGSVLVLVALTRPALVYPLYRGLLPVARAIGVVNTWLLLGFVFFGILLPFGWVLRRLGRLQYRTGFDPAATTYRIEVPRDHVTRLEEPF